MSYTEWSTEPRLGPNLLTPEYGTNMQDDQEGGKQEGESENMAGIALERNLPYFKNNKKLAIWAF